MELRLTTKQILGGIIFLLWVVSLACVTSGVRPEDPRLQAPLSTIGMIFDNFLKQLNAVPAGGIMAPWITSPGDRIYNSDPVVVVKGWAQYEPNSELIIYSVEPNIDLTRANRVIKELARTTVNQDTYEWQAQVHLSEQSQYIAARIEVSQSKMSPFSNIIYINLGEPRALIITSPKADEVVKGETITLEGTGEPKTTLVLTMNNEVTNLGTTIQPDGNWKIDDIPLAIAGFDKDKPHMDLNRNVLTVRAEATNQEASVVVRRIEPIQILWPFGSGDTGKGETYIPDPALAQVSAFFNNDWHLFDEELHTTHPALDISSGKSLPIHAVSSGTVVAFGSETYGNYVIIDSGGWGVLYLHIVEDKDNSKVKIGDKVQAGQIIATEGRSGTTPVHLHLEIRVWDPSANRSHIGIFFEQKTTVNLNPPIGYKDHLKPKNIDLYNRWGGSDYCHKDGCWKGLDWTKVNLWQSLPTDESVKGCWNEEGKYTYIKTSSAYSVRKVYCYEERDQCKCP
jgi:murein DD-endopeptidase MepM/ murein hydrolase activator NlpD